MLSAAISAKAVILAGGDGAQNTNAPSGGQGWDYVGRIDHPTAYSSVTYISNNWFVTAYHIKALDNPTGVLLGGVDYDIDPNSWTRLTNSVGGNADLIMFRVVGGTVGLPGLAVRPTTTLPTSSLTMIGNGRNREASETTWNSSWVEGGKPTVYRGYKWASVGSAKRWGTNVKDDDAGLVNSGESFGVTEMFYTDFDRTGGTVDEAQGATFDSGGGVFYDNGSQWELAGIMITVGNLYSGQPWSPPSIGSAVYGNLTLIADMQYYAAQIALTTQNDDLDGDGIPDGWEYEYSGSTTGVVATADQDGDGFSGEQEWITDTIPTDSNSYLRVTDFPGGTNVVFSSSTNREYQVQYVPGLTNSSWAIEVDWFAGSHSQTVQSVSTAASNRFYRVRAKL